MESRINITAFIAIDWTIKILLNSIMKTTDNSNTKTTHNSITKATHNSITKTIHNSSTKATPNYIMTTSRNLIIKATHYKDIFLFLTLCHKLLCFWQWLLMSYCEALSKHHHLTKQGKSKQHHGKSKQQQHHLVEWSMWQFISVSCILGIFFI